MLGGAGLLNRALKLGTSHFLSHCESEVLLQRERSKGDKGSASNSQKLSPEERALVSKASSRQYDSFCWNSSSYSRMDESETMTSSIKIFFISLSSSIFHIQEDVIKLK